MRHLIAALLFTTATTCTGHAACTMPPADTLSVIIRADNARDLDAVLREYTDDVVWIPPSRAPTSGLAAIRASYVTMYGTFTPALSIAFAETLTDHDLAVVRGTTHGTLMPKEGAATTVNDNFIATLRCTADRWLVSRMMWAPAAKP